MKTKKIIIAIIILLITLTGAFCTIMSIGMLNPLEHHIKLAVKYMNEGKYEEAILEFDKSIEINNRIPQIYLVKANAEYAIDDEEATFNSITAAIKIMSEGKTEENNITLLLENNLTKKESLMDKDELMIWWYKKSFEQEDPEAYNELRNWIEKNISDKYVDELADIKAQYSVYGLRKYLDIYNDILSEYKQAEKNNYYDGDFEKCKNVNPEIYLSGYKMPLYYAVNDINSDGIPELFIAEKREPDEFSEGGMNIYDIYYMDGAPKRIFDIYSMGYRSKYTIYEDGVIGCYGDGGISVGGYEFFRINSPSANDEIATRIEYLRWEDNGSKRYFVTHENGDANTEITEKEYTNAVAKYKEKKDIEWSILSEYSL